MPLYQFHFIGRTKGALGTHSRYTADRHALTEEKAFVALYDQYEHILVSRVEVLDPFTLEFALNRRKPLAFHILDAKRPLVMAHQPYHEMREDFVQTARNIRSPHLYLDGVSLAAMGGEPYANWY